MTLSDLELVLRILAEIAIVFGLTVPVFRRVP